MMKLAGMWRVEFSSEICPSDPPDKEELELLQMSPGKERNARVNETNWHPEQCRMSAGAILTCQKVRLSVN